MCVRVSVCLKLQACNIFITCSKHKLYYKWHNLFPFSEGKIAVGFMKHYVSIMGDHHPESARILLPVGITVTEIYRRYCQYHRDDVVSLSRFHELWTYSMKHVSYQKVIMHVSTHRVAITIKSVSIQTPTTDMLIKSCAPQTGIEIYRHSLTVNFLFIIIVNIYWSM